MNEEEIIETSNQSIIEDLIEDLSLQNAEEIKGGPNDYPIGGDCPRWRCGSNHNETTAEDEEEAEAVEDLPVEDEAEAEVKGGGLLLPAVQKVR